MPAVEHTFLDPVPDHLYVDTDIFINYLIGTQPHHPRCRAFLERLKLEAHTTLYISSLSWLEVAHVITRPGFRDELACAAQEGIADCASLDAAYRPVDDLDLWNDLIHGVRGT